MLCRSEWNEWGAASGELDDDYAERIKNTFTFRAEDVPEHLRMPDHHTDGRSAGAQQAVVIQKILSHGLHMLADVVLAGYQHSTIVVSGENGFHGASWAVSMCSSRPRKLRHATEGKHPVSSKLPLTTVCCALCRHRTSKGLGSRLPASARSQEDLACRGIRPCPAADAGEDVSCCSLYAQS